MLPLKINSVPSPSFRANTKMLKLIIIFSFFFITPSLGTETLVLPPVLTSGGTVKEFCASSVDIAKFYDDLSSKTWLLLDDGTQILGKDINGEIIMLVNKGEISSLSVARMVCDLLPEYETIESMKELIGLPVDSLIGLKQPKLKQAGLCDFAKVTTDGIEKEEKVCTETATYYCAENYPKDYNIMMNGLNDFLKMDSYDFQMYNSKVLNSTDYVKMMKGNNYLNYARYRPLFCAVLKLASHVKALQDSNEEIVASESVTELNDNNINNNNNHDDNNNENNLVTIKELLALVSTTPEKVEKLLKKLSKNIVKLNEQKGNEIAVNIKEISRQIDDKFNSALSAIETLSELFAEENTNKTFELRKRLIETIRDNIFSYLEQHRNELGRWLPLASAISICIIAFASLCNIGLKVISISTDCQSAEDQPSQCENQPRGKTKKGVCINVPSKKFLGVKRHVIDV